MQLSRVSAVPAALVLACSAANAATISEEEELALAYGDKSFVNIATGSRVPVVRAASVATVMTAEDIQALGAADLDEALETVPGLHVSRSPVLYTPIYTIRGIRRTLTNPQVLLLINGIPLKMAYTGDRGVQWGGLSTENIARIEVIRGPGSAVYGADAFAGVINVITKTAQQIDGALIAARAGSFDTTDGWVQYGRTFGELSIAGSVRVSSTAGSTRVIEEDAQTGFDRLFAAFGAPAVSHAPGTTDLGRDAVDAALDVSYGGWRLRSAYLHRDRMGSGAGVAQALDPTGRSSSKRFTSDLTYEDGKFAKDWEITAQASYAYYNERSDLVLFPAGAFAGAFADGMIGNPYKWERHGRLSLSAFYSGVATHRIRLGLGYQKEDLYRARETKNFNPDFSPIGSGSRADLTDVSETAPFIRPRARTVRYAYVQDEWNFARDWTLTAGARHDHYSDFGNTTNPRFALVWDAAYNVTAKLLYGTAFRAPAFTELYSINNPVNIGNPALRPEKIRTVETAVAWQPAGGLQVGANVFRYRMRDIITLVGTTWMNSGTQTGYGMEIEAVWDATPTIRLSGNYGRQRSTDETTDQDAGLAPRQRAYLRGDWRFTPGWHTNVQVNRVAGRKREPGDTRPEVRDYTTVDLALRAEGQRRAWDVALIVRNLFNADAREPSPFGTPFVSIPNDLPLPGRAYYLQGNYRF